MELLLHIYLAILTKNLLAFSGAPALYDVKFSDDDDYEYNDDDSTVVVVVVVVVSVANVKET